MLTPSQTNQYLDAIDDAKEALADYTRNRNWSTGIVVGAILWILGWITVGALSTLTGIVGHHDIGFAIFGLVLAGVLVGGAGVVWLFAILDENAGRRLNRAVRKAERAFQNASVED